MGKEKIIPIFAMALMLIGTFSALYVHATSSTKVVDEDEILVNGKTLTFQDIFSTIEKKTIETNEGSKTGIALDDLIKKNFDGCYGCHSYMIEGEDGYKKTVDWGMIQKGILSKEARVFFPESAHAFWVRDIVRIEVR